MRYAAKKAPRRLWLAFDSESGELLAWFRSRSAARKECLSSNARLGYTPTCRVVEYVATEYGSEAK